MIPSTIVGVILFAALLTPGFVALERFERFHPSEPRSGVRETALAVRTSIGSLAVTLTLFALVRLARPSWTPDVGDLIRHPRTAFNDDYLRIVITASLVLLVASTLAALWVVPPAWPDWSEREWWSRRRGSQIKAGSGWSVAFCPDAKKPSREQWLFVTLTDGTTLRGRRKAHNPSLDEDDNRDLVLVGPIERRALGESDWIVLAAAQYLVVNASRIQYLTVEHVS